MAPSDKEAKAQWAAYLKAKLNAKGWDAVRLVAESGNELTYKSVNNWVTARAIPDPEILAVVAEVLDTDLAEVLRAANKPRLAKRFSEQHPRPADSESEPIDDVERLIYARKGLTPERKAEEVARYRRRMARVLADTNDILNAIAAPDDEAKSA